MSAFKGTPGPWYWSPDYKTGDGRATWSLIGSDGYGILSCDGEENSPQGLSDGANALLIAAAPDLLEVAQRSADALRSAGIEPRATSDNPLEWLLHQTEAAIAKATGEQS